MTKVTTPEQPPSDLLTHVPLRRRRAGNSVQPPELTAAQALCRQLRRKHNRHDKQRVAHLICLNLIAMLKRAGSGCEKS